MQGACRCVQGACRVRAGCVQGACRVRCMACLVADHIAVDRRVERLHVAVELVHECLRHTGLQAVHIGLQAGHKGMHAGHMHRVADSAGRIRECLLLLLARALHVLARVK